MKYQLKHITEYTALRSIAGVFRILPYKHAAMLGCKVTDVLYSLMSDRVAEAERRIKLVFGNDLSEEKIKRIAWQSLQNFVLCYVDLFVSDKITRDKAEQISTLNEQFWEVLARCQKGEGAVISAPHMGSWEMAITIGRVYGMPLFSLAAGQHNPLVTAYINKLRSAPGLETVLRGSEAGIRQVISLLKQGKVFAIMPDVRMRAHSIPVSFLGGTAHIGYGMAVFARRANVPVFPCIPKRLGLTHHKIDLLPPVMPDNSLDFTADITRITTTVMQMIEVEIRKVPEQWFWYNKRWILDPL